MPLIAEDAEGGVGSGDNQCFLENNCSREQLFSRTVVRERVGLSGYCRNPTITRKCLDNFVTLRIRYLFSTVMCPQNP